MGCASEALASDDTVCRGGCPAGWRGEKVYGETTYECAAWGPPSKNRRCIRGEDVNKTQCYQCPQGYFQAGVMSSTCAACPAGYAAGKGAPECGRCADGSWSARTSSACTACSAGKHGVKGSNQTSSLSHCQACPRGKFQQKEGLTYCETVAEGKMVSTEPAEVVDTLLLMPSTDQTIGEDPAASGALEAAMMARLVLDLGIDAGYIELKVATRLTRRLASLLSGSAGLEMSIVVKTADGDALGDQLTKLTSAPEFWEGINSELSASAAALRFTNTTGATIVTTARTCNENFSYDSAIGACVAVPIECARGMYAKAGTGVCSDCPPGKYSATAGAFACESCVAE